MRLESFHQIAFEVSQLRIQRREMVANGLGHENVVRTQFTLQRG